MDEIYINTDYITLGQLLKLAGFVDSGSIAKLVIKDGLVSVNNEIDTRRGRKLYDGDIVEFEGKTCIVKHDN